MKPFLHGKKTLDTAPLRPPHAAHAVPTAPGLVRPNGSPAPVVDVVKAGDKVVRLVITCSCGERIEVECLYPAGS